MSMCDDDGGDVRGGRGGCGATFRGKDTGYTKVVRNRAGLTFTHLLYPILPYIYCLVPFSTQ
ncbi:hypothetical protein J6590_020482 [Homalodisca vitripennis]|nr:hypothetical protein J6590_020482 [Homalodisca vitripennis]